jgi:hypothetical protein
VKIWEITGFTGENLENSFINRCGKNTDVIFTIESGYANITPSSNLAAGDGVVVVKGKISSLSSDIVIFSAGKKVCGQQGREGCI